MNITFNVNALGLVAIILICGSIIEIVKQIVSGVTTSKAMKQLMNMPEKQRGKVIDKVLDTKDKK